MVKEYLHNIRKFSANARWYLIGNMLHWIGFAGFTVLFNLYLTKAGWSDTQIGYAISANAWGIFIIAIPAAWIIDRFHTKTILVTTIIAGAAFYALRAIVPSLSGILILGLVGQMALTVKMLVNAPFLMRNSSPEERIYLFAICSAGMLLANSIGSILGGYLPVLAIKLGWAATDVESYRYGLFLALGLSLLACGAHLQIKPTPLPEHKRHIFARLKELDWKLIFRLHSPKIFVGMGAGLMVPFMNLYFHHVHGMESKQIGYFFAGVQVATFLGMAATPMLVSKIGKYNTMLSTQSISIPLILILAFTGNIYLAVMAFIMRGTFMNMANPVKANFDMEIVREDQRTLTTMMNLVLWNGAWAISSLFGGRLIDYDPSFKTSFLITAGLYVVSSVCYVIFVRPVRCIKSGTHASMGQLSVDGYQFSVEDKK